MKRFSVISAVLCILAQPALAEIPLGNPVGTRVGEVVGLFVGLPLSVDVGSALPVGIGGITVITALSLIIGIQLVKRRRK